MKKGKRLTAGVLMLLLMCSFASCSTPEEHMQKRFDRMVQKSYITAMESDYMACHVLWEHPEQQGIKQKNMETSLGFRPTAEAFQEIRSNLAEEETAWKPIDRSKLKPEQQDTYDLLYFEFTSSQKLYQEKFDNYHPYSDTSIGALAMLPTVLVEFPVRSEQDVQELILLLEDSQDYVNTYIDYMAAQLDAGTLLADIPACTKYYETIAQQGEDSGFLNELLEKTEQIALSTRQADDYKAQIRSAFSSFFLAAYGKAAERVKGMEGSETPASYAAMPDGKEYYEALAQYKLGTSKTIEELKTELQGTLNMQLATMLKIGLSNREALDFLISDDYATPYSTYQEAASALEKAIQSNFPALEKSSYTIEEIPAGIGGQQVSAYYMQSAADSDSPASIRVNPAADTPAKVENFLILAHESFPGHLYQTQYAAEHFKEKPWRYAFYSWMGFTEGYASYVGAQAINYLSFDEDVAALYQANTLFQNCFIALAELGIQYDGWSPEEQTAFAQKYKIEEANAASIYSLVSTMPSTYLCYYAGMAVICNLKEKAQDALGDRFQLLQFHTVLVGSGDMTLDLLEKKVDGYISDSSEELVNSVAA